MFNPDEVRCNTCNVILAPVNIRQCSRCQEPLCSCCESGPCEYEARPDIPCPSNDYKPGVPSGQCWGDGHYMCPQCVQYREDFKRLGQDYIDFAHTCQHGLIITTL